ETRIFYAIDLGKSYRLLEESLLEQEGWTKDRLHENALFNLRSLSTSYKKDEVSGNDFYFIATQDGYDASRILNIAFLDEMAAKCEGVLTLAITHQDVVILTDLNYEACYDVLAQLSERFSADGRIPLTSFAFLYKRMKLQATSFITKHKAKNKIK